MLRENSHELIYSDEKNEKKKKTEDRWNSCFSMFFRRSNFTSKIIVFLKTETQRVKTFQLAHESEQETEWKRPLKNSKAVIFDIVKLILGVE